jgi:hypothetical protein
VISALIHIGSELEEPWPFEVEDHDGVLHAINLQPGQVPSSLTGSPLLGVYFHFLRGAVPCCELLPHCPMNSLFSMT